MKSKSAKVNGSAGSRWRPTSSCSEWKVPLGSLSRRRISSGRYSASSGSLLGRSSETGIRGRDPADVPLQQPDFLLAAGDQLGVARPEAADVERAAALLHAHGQGLEAGLLDGLHGQGHAVDVELRGVAVGGGEGELVVVL